MDPQAADRLIALWKSGRDKYASFYAVLNEVRQEIGDEALPSWCYNKLGIGISVILRYKDLLDTDDEIGVERNFKKAENAEKEQARKQKEEEKLKRDEERRKRELEEAEHKKKLAELARKATEEKIANNKLKDNETRREKDKKNINKRGVRAGAMRKQRRIVQNINEKELAELKQQWFEAERTCEAGIIQWVEGSIAKAIILRAMRDKIPANQEFGAWCMENIPKLNYSDRAALIGLGGLEKNKLRQILTNSESKSYQLIWRAISQLTVVND